MAPRPEVEQAIFEVEVGGEWVEYFRVHRKRDESWQLLRIAEVRPKTRVRYIKIADGNN